MNEIKLHADGRIVGYEPDVKYRKDGSMKSVIYCPHYPEFLWSDELKVQQSTMLKYCEDNELDPNDESVWETVRSMYETNKEDKSHEK